MKTLIGVDAGSYSFSPGTPGVGTITLYWMPALSVSQILLIVDATAGVLIVNPMNPSLNCQIANNVLTFDLDTSGLSPTDQLQIYVDIPAAQPIPQDSLAQPTDNDQWLEPSEQMPQAVAPYLPGQQPAALSWPMALANEDILDLQPQNPIAMTAPPINTVLAFQDCLQYRSVAVQIDTGAGISAGVLTFEGSNTRDSVLWAPVALIAVTTAAPVTASTVTLAASTNVFYQGAVNFRYFRVRVSTAVAGGMVAVYPVYRMATFDGHQGVNIANWGGTAVTAGAAAPFNEAQYAGTAAVTGGVAGLPGVGGNIAAGTAPTANPVPIGGISSASTGLTTRILTDTAGQQQVVGPDPSRSISTQPVIIRSMDEIAGRYNQTELLEMIYVKLWEMAYYLHEMGNFIETPDDFVNLVPRSLDQQ